MALGPLPPVANVLRIRLNGTNNTMPWVALFYWHYIGGAPTGAQVSTFCGQVSGVYAATLVQAFNPVVAMNSVDAWDLSSPAGATGTGGTVHLGTRTGGPLPTSVAAVCGWKVNYRWRGGHPRTYWPAGCTTDVGNGHLWGESARAAFEAGNEGFLSQMNALTLGGTGGYLTAIRYVHTVIDSPTAKHVEYFNPPLDLQISRAVVDARLDTQRRRLGPDL